MKVLLVHCFYRSSAPSGEDSVYRNEKNLLQDNGIEVITYEKYNDNLDNNSSLKKIAAGAEFIWSNKAFREITEIIKSNKPDLVHFHNIFPQISTSAYSACRKMGVPVVQTLHNFRYICPAGLLQRNNQPCEKCISSSLFFSIIHKCYRNSTFATLPMAAMIAFNRAANNFSKNVDRYIALTQFGKSRFIAGGLPQNKITIKPNFINDIGYIGSEAGDYIVYVGRLTQEKGVATLIEACKTTKHIPLKIVGDGELRAQLQTICIQHDLNVEFLGYQNKDNVISIIKKSRFLVLPSECYEGFPVTVAEAFACGKPVLASKIGSLDEIIQDDYNGKKFAFGSAIALAENMNNMWSNPDALETMANNARLEFDNKYNSKNNFNLLYNIYKEVIEQRQ